MDHNICVAVSGSSNPIEDGQHDCQRFPAIGRQGPHDVLANIVVDRAAFAHRRDDRGEIVVEQDDVGRLLGGFGAFQSHRHADIRRLQRRRVVDSIAGHGDDRAIGLERPDDPQLMLGAGAREHRYPLDGHCQLGIGQAIELGADHPLEMVGQIELAANGKRGCGVIAGDHLDRDARRAALRDGRHRLGTERIDEAHDAEKVEARQVGGGKPLLTIIQPLASESQHAFTLRSRLSDGLVPMIRVSRLRRHRQHGFGRSLDEGEPLPRRTAMQRRHVTMPRIEGYFIQSRPLRPDVGGIQPSLVCEGDESALHRIAGDDPARAPLLEGRIVAQHPAPQQGQRRGDRRDIVIARLETPSGA